MVTRKIVEVEYEDEGKIKKASSWQVDGAVKEEEEEKEAVKIKPVKKDR